VFSSRQSRRRRIIRIINCAAEPSGRLPEVGPNVSAGGSIVVTALQARLNPDRPASASLIRKHQRKACWTMSKRCEVHVNTSSSSCTRFRLCIV
jgi:hypothetical protein